MEKHWVKEAGNRALIIFALGWAADHRAVAHIRPAGYDVLSLYDYRTMETVRTEEVAGYERIYLFGWSFGVWAAEQALREVPLTRAVALNGTPVPVHDTYGIPARAFAVTLRGIASAGIDGFNRRAYDEFHERAVVTRPFEVLYDELQALHRMAVKPYTPALTWDHAVIGSRDLIFPPDHMAAYWESRGIAADLPHYPFGDPETVLRFLNETIEA